VRCAKIAALVLSLVSIGLVDPVAAQLSIIPSEVPTKVRALGPVLHDEVRSSARSLYAPLHTKPGPEIVVNTDLPYGPDERQKLDVLTPALKPPAAMPVVVFVHGGMFTRGDKTTPGTPFFQHIAASWARNGMVGVNINYRLAPKHQWPAGAQDVGAAVKWARDNIRDYGGDPSRIVLMGQSAGASHIAGYLFHKELWLSGGDGVIGAILLSGGYAIRPLDRRTQGVPIMATTRVSGQIGSLSATLPRELSRSSSHPRSTTRRGISWTRSAFSGPFASATTGVLR
jgi:acetyl esterase/lipase